MTASPDRVDTRYAGIDVSKDHLELALCGGDGTPVGAPCRLPNTVAGLQALSEALERAAPRLVAVEATGASHLPLVRVLVAAQIPVAVVNPVRVKAFRQRRLERTKTDRQDARLLARFAGLHASELVPYTPPPAARAAEPAGGQRVGRGAPRHPLGAGARPAAAPSRLSHLTRQHSCYEPAAA